MECGEVISVCFPNSKSTPRNATIMKIKKSKKEKHGSLFKYYLKFEDSVDPKDIVKTRLLNLQWTTIESMVAPKRFKKSVTESISMKKLPVSSITMIGRIPINNLRYILAPMVICHLFFIFSICNNLAELYM